MNLPNKLTLLRVVMIPLFVALFFAASLPHHLLWALGVFVLAALTDALDGYLARSRGLVTDFGILMDPLADKLLVMAAMICFVGVGLAAAWVVIVILAREFLITSIRLVAAGKGTVIAADRYGKLKTVCQMVWVCVGLVHLWLSAAQGQAHVALWPPFVAGVFLRLYIGFTIATLFFTVLSGVNYTVKNRGLFKAK